MPLLRNLSTLSATMQKLAGTTGSYNKKLEGTAGGLQRVGSALGTLDKMLAKMRQFTTDWSDATRAAARSTNLMTEAFRGNFAHAAEETAKHAKDIGELLGLPAAEAGKLAADTRSTYHMLGREVSQVGKDQVAMLTRFGNLSAENVSKLQRGMVVTLGATEDQMVGLSKELTASAAAWNVDANVMVGGLLERLGTASALDETQRKEFFTRTMRASAVFERASQQFKDSVTSMQEARGDAMIDQLATLSAITDINPGELWTAIQDLSKGNKDEQQAAAKMLYDGMERGMSGMFGADIMNDLRSLDAGTLGNIGDRILDVVAHQGAADDLLKAANINFSGLMALAEGRDRVPLSGEGDALKGLDKLTGDTSKLGDALSETTTVAEQVTANMASAAKEADGLAKRLSELFKGVGVDLAPDRIAAGLRTGTEWSGTAAGLGIAGGLAGAGRWALGRLRSRGGPGGGNVTGGRAGGGGGKNYNPYHKPGTLKRAAWSMRSKLATASKAAKIGGALTTPAVLLGETAFTHLRSNEEAEASFQQRVADANADRGGSKLDILLGTLKGYGDALLNTPKAAGDLGHGIRLMRQNQAKAAEAEKALDDALLQEAAVQAVIKSQEMGSPIDFEMAKAHLLSERATKGTFSTDSALVALFDRSQAKLNAVAAAEVEEPRAVVEQEAREQQHKARVEATQERLAESVEVIQEAAARWMRSHLN